MRIAVAGAHGQIALQLIPLLAARGDEVIGLIRNPDHAEEIRVAGADPVVCDLERADVSEVASAVAGCDAVVFAAGAGPGSGAERKLTMDRDGAIKLIEASGTARYVMVSSVGAQDPPGGDEVFAVYLQAKAEADAALTATERDWIVLRPGRLNDQGATGRVRLDETPFRGEIARGDVAAVVAALLSDDAPGRRIVYVNSGETPIDDAVRAL